MCTKTIKAFTYISTPIYYVNANPHIGHLYSSLIADAAQRWQKVRYRQEKIRFSTGTDEHGTKIQQAAKTHNTSLMVYCDGISSKFRHLADTFSVQYTDFIRTSEDRHKKSVQHFWNCLDEKGHIYKSKYQGWYCVSDETFLTDSQLKEITNKNGEKILVSVESGHPVEWSEEQNYIFKLSSFRDDLVYWLKSNDQVIRPQKFQKILLDLINREDTLADISVSRPTTRVHWGIPVPNDESQSIYVWLDALINYLTVSGYSQVSDTELKTRWPPLHVIGKDILKFHGIYWPAFLLAAGLEPPLGILCHSHWTVDGEKMSKSKGNVIDPLNISETYSTDGIRYFLLREGVSHSDGNYSDTKLTRIINSELADTLGNLLSRCCGKALNPGQTFPKIKSEALYKISLMDVTIKLLDNIQNLPETCDGHYNDFNFYKVADCIIATLHSANLFFETLKPWELKKNQDTLEDLKVVLHLAMESLRISGILLQPLIPNICDRLLNKLSVPKDSRYFENVKTFTWENPKFVDVPLSSDTAVLLKRIITEDITKRKSQKA